MQRILAVVMLILLGGCSASSSGAPVIEPPPAVPPAAAKEQVDYSCRTDADCEVKDVGNCCGYFPACVNSASPTFPQRVREECSREGTSSICGFEEISSCRCVDQRCRPAASAGAGLPLD